MALLEIIKNPHPTLRRKAHKVEVFDKDFQTLASNMIETMRDAPGVGLAATQVGESLRLIVVEFAEENDEGEEISPKRLYVVANPEIAVTSEETVTGTEACLSVPGLAGEVERFVEITVKGKNRRGQAIKIEAKGWLARIFQHEIDHLNGVLYIDRASRIWKPREDEAAILAD
jgi:peptide deformylase